MEFIALGNSAMYPKVGGACSSYIIRAKKTKILIDIGTGTLSRLLRVVDPCTLDAIFISRWTPDHSADLFALASFYGENLDKDKQIKVYCLEEQVSFFYQEALRFPCFHVICLADGQVLNLSNLDIFVKKAEQGLQSLHFAVCAEGKKLVCTGDTKVIAELVGFCKAADVLICDACYPHSEWEEGKPHLSAKLTGELAKEAQAKLVLLSHLSPKINEELIFYEAFASYPKCQILKTEHLYRI